MCISPSHLLNILTEHSTEQENGASFATFSWMLLHNNSIYEYLKRTSSVTVTDYMQRVRLPTHVHELFSGMANL